MTLNLIKEEWRDIEGYDNRYKVSNKGRVSSNYSGSYKLLKAYDKREGYTMVNLYVNANSKAVYVHRLVGETFIPNPKNKPQINHKNGIKDDNRLENLEWVTRSQNMKHAWDKLGLVSPNSIPLKCITLNIETESVSEMSRLLQEKGYAEKCSITNIFRRIEKGDRFNYKGLEFKVIEL